MGALVTHNYTATGVNSQDTSKISKTKWNAAHVISGIGDPSFHAYRSSNQTLLQNTSEIIICSTEEWDNGNCHDTTTGRFCPQVAGLYYISTQVLMTFVAPLVSVRNAIFLNGADLERSEMGIADGAAPFGGWWGGSANTCLNLNGTTDYVESRVYYTLTTGATGSYAYGGQAYINFSAYRLLG